MSIFRLKPLDLGHPSWEASTHKGECVVRAPSEKVAREMADDQFGGPREGSWVRMYRSHLGRT